MNVIPDGCSYAPVYVVIKDVGTPEAAPVKEGTSHDFLTAYRVFTSTARHSDVALRMSTGLESECLLRFERGQLSSDGLAVRA